PLSYSLSTTAVKYSRVGNYPITVTLRTNPHYPIPFPYTTLFRSQKDATVVADHKAKTYGDDNPALTAVVTGTVNGDTLSYSLSTTAVNYSEVGNYPHTVTLGTNPNYHVTKTDDTMTVGQKDATVV